jgi:hypothetical protein
MNTKGVPAGREGRIIAQNPKNGVSGVPGGVRAQL